MDHAATPAATAGDTAGAPCRAGTKAEGKANSATTAAAMAMHRAITERAMSIWGPLWKALWAQTVFQKRKGLDTCKKHLGQLHSVPKRLLAKHYLVGVLQNPIGPACTHTDSLETTKTHENPLQINLTCPKQNDHESFGTHWKIIEMISFSTLHLFISCGSLGTWLLEVSVYQTSLGCQVSGYLPSIV